MLLEHKGRRLNVVSALARLAERPVVTRADALEAIDVLCRKLFVELHARGHLASCIDEVLNLVFGGLDADGSAVNQPLLQPALRARSSVFSQVKKPRVQESTVRTIPVKATHQDASANTEIRYDGLRRILGFSCRELVPNLARASDEIDNLLSGLAGGYVPAGPSGSPTRGMAHILPTGRNFYSVDPRSVPSQSAWRVGSAIGA